MLARTCLLWMTFSLTFLGANAFGEELSFPDSEWKTVSAAEIGWDPDKLQDAIDFAFERRTSSIVIVHGGRILSERHETLSPPSRRYSGSVKGKNSLGHAKEDIASVQKSIVSILTGIAIEKALLGLEDPVSKHLGNGWSKAGAEAEGKIKVRHLLTMTSGLTPQLSAVAEAGKQWRYNSTAYGKTLKCLEKASGMTANELTSAWLLDPIGMKESQWASRPSAFLAASDANDVGFVTTARDLARFGLLVQAQGKWDGQTVLGDETYLSQALNSSQRLNLAYGYLWWLNGKRSGIRQGRRVNQPLITAAPSDLVAGFGALGRKCYVVPSLNLVVTRLGDTPESQGQESFNEGFWRRLMRAVPNRPSGRK
ncbi:MAG: serine hydrolase [Planctomycetota bacterium]